MPWAAWAEVKVASLSTVLSDVAKNVGGDRVAITTLIRPGADPHLFEPSPADVKAAREAQLVLASGLGLEAYLPKLRAATGNGPRFVIVGDAIKPLKAESSHDHHDHGEDEPDPHWWHSIANVRTATRVIRDALVQAAPEDRAVFQENARRYLEKLDVLQRWAEVQIATLPRDRRVLVTSHDALCYFAHDYHFTIHPVQGISTADEPSSKAVRQLIAKIRAAGVKAIFAENIENPKILTEITRETGAKIGGTLYADGLGETEANTYESMMRHNVSTITGALR